MAHFARIEAGVVREVIVVKNAAIGGGTFPESEPIGQQLLTESGLSGTWLQCSWSGSFRGDYPGPGWRYDTAADLFIAPESTP